MWLIIGYGNLLRGDDGAGSLLAEQLRQLLPADGARVLPVHQLTPELALEIAAPGIDRLLFLDARRGQWEPLILTPLNPAAAAGSCGHQLSPELLLHLAASLYGQAPPAWLLTLAAGNLKLGDPLSPVTTAALPFALQRILGLIAALDSQNIG